MTTVLEMHEQLAELNAELLEEGMPQLDLRAGVSTGEVVVGDTGGTEAVDYTCIGDIANLGARLESANKFICHKRMKVSGAWWYKINGNRMLRLRCSMYNGTFDAVFATIGLVLSAWFTQIPQFKAALSVSDGQLGVALLCPAAGALLSM